MTPLLTPPIAFALHVLANRCIRSRSQQRAAMIVSVMAAFIVLVVSWGDALQNIWTFVTSLGFGYCYFHLFNITETAIRPQILNRLAKNPDIADTSLIYDDEARVTHRLDRLESFGVIWRVEGGYTAKPSLMGVVARLFCHPTLRRLFDYHF